MAIVTTPLGFQKPDGTDPVRNGDNVISANAAKGEELHQDARGRLTVIEAKNAQQDTDILAARTNAVADAKTYTDERDEAYRTVDRALWRSEDDSHEAAAKAYADGLVATDRGRLTTIEATNATQDTRITSVEGKTQDTGWRIITTTNTDAGAVSLRRVGNVVTAQIRGIIVTPGSGEITFATLPTGFKANSVTAYGLVANAADNSVLHRVQITAGALSWIGDFAGVKTTRPTFAFGGVVSWVTADAWPVTLPGSQDPDGANLTIYGHSYTTVPGAYSTAGMEWPTQVARSFNLTQLNHGISGARMTEMAVAAVGTAVPGKTGNRSYPAGRPGVVIIEAEQNDILFGPYTAAGRAGFKHSLRSLLATVTASQRIEASAATPTGTWATLNGSTFSGGSIMYSSGSVLDQRHLEFTGISSPKGHVYILTLANAQSSATGTLNVSVDGVDQGINYVGQGSMESFTSNLAGTPVYNYSPAVIKVTVPPTGTHTIRVSRMIGSTIGTTYVDSILIPSMNPPAVVVCQDPPVTNPPATAARADAWTTYSPVFNGHIAEICAEFGPNVVVADLAPGWDSMTMAATADAARFHPNDLGMTLIAQNVEPGMVTALNGTTVTGLRG